MTVAQSPVDVRMEFLRKTYGLFLAGLICSMLVCTATFTNHSLLVLSASMPFILRLVLMVGLVIGAQAASRIEGLNYALLFTFTGAMGFIIAPVLYVYNITQPGIVMQAGLLTTITFSALTAYVFVSKKDFSFLGGLLFVGLIGLVLGGFANLLLFHSPLTSYFMAWVGVFIFSGYVLYDTSNIMRRYDSRAYCSAALSLFLDFFNMFLYILQILGGSRR